MATILNDVHYCLPSHMTYLTFSVGSVSESNKGRGSEGGNDVLWSIK